MGSEERRKCLSRGSTEQLAKGLTNRKKEKLLLERFVDRAEPGVQCWRRVWVTEETVYFVDNPGSREAELWL